MSAFFKCKIPSGENLCYAMENVFLLKIFESQTYHWVNFLEGYMVVKAVNVTDVVVAKKEGSKEAIVLKNRKNVLGS